MVGKLRQEEQGPVTEAWGCDLGRQEEESQGSSGNEREKEQVDAGLTRKPGPDLMGECGHGALWDEDSPVQVPLAGPGGQM